jgi:anti-sigma regulatory factor (Ser/Thr protein kinase)
MTKQVQKVVFIRLDSSKLHMLRDTLDEIMREGNIKEKEKELLILAIDEAVSSMVYYAREKGYDHEIAISIDINEVRFKATITDPMTVFGDNIGYDQLVKDRKYKISFYLICKIMDEINYTFKKGFENRLELLKFL